MVTITTYERPVILPDEAQAAGLLRVVKGAHPNLSGVDDLAEFRRAFAFVSRLFRLPEPNSKRYWSSWCDDCNEFCARRGGRGVSAPALFSAVLASGDLRYRAANAAVGDVLEIAADLYSGKPANPDAWRKLLAGEANLMQPVRARDPAKDQVGRSIPQPRFFVQQPTGEFTESELETRAIYGG